MSITYRNVTNTSRIIIIIIIFTLYIAWDFYREAYTGISQNTTYNVDFFFDKGLDNKCIKVVAISPAVESSRIDNHILQSSKLICFCENPRPVRRLMILRLKMQTGVIVGNTT